MANSMEVQQLHRVSTKTGASVWIGRKASDDIYLHGTMDDLAVINIALTEVEIKRYMGGGIKAAVNALGKLAVSWGEIKSR